MFQCLKYRRRGLVNFDGRRLNAQTMPPDVEYIRLGKAGNRTKASLIRTAFLFPCVRLSLSTTPHLSYNPGLTQVDPTSKIQHSRFKHNFEGAIHEQSNSAERA